MPRPPSLSRSGIAEAAVAVIARDGLAALSMRTVAAELDVGAMSLYRYVESREELESLVVDLVLGAVDPELPKRASWPKRVTILLERVRAAVGENAFVLPLVLARRHTNEGALRWAEVLLGVLAGAGFEGKARAIAFRTLLSYTIGAIQVEHFGPLSGTGTSALAALPRARYPFLAQTASHARRIAPDEEFRRGLDVVLRGLGAAVPRR
jgi:AcrR family transcriptional regulator